MGEKEATATKKSPAEKVSEVVDAWFSEHVMNSAISRETQAWQAACTARDKLKETLLANLF